MKRKGMGKGKGKGYKNIIKGYDKKVHTDSRKGIKQPQRMPHLPIKKELPKKATKSEINKTFRLLKEEGVKTDDIYSLQEFPTDFFNEVPQKYAFDNLNYVYLRNPDTHASLIYDRRNEKIILLRKKSYWKQHMKR